MTNHPDFTDAELDWLAKIEKGGANPPDRILDNLVEFGGVDRTNAGPKITGLGRLVIVARKNRRLPLRRM